MSGEQILQKNNEKYVWGEISSGDTIRLTSIELMDYIDNWRYLKNEKR